MIISCEYETTDGSGVANPVATVSTNLTVPLRSPPLVIVPVATLGGAPGGMLMEKSALTCLQLLCPHAHSASESRPKAQIAAARATSVIGFLCIVCCSFHSGGA